MDRAGALTRLTLLVLLCAVAVVADANDGPPAVWEEIRVGQRVDEATKKLRVTHANASLSRPDGGGYSKFWPVDKATLNTTGEIERVFFPHGHVLVLQFDSGRIITEISREFVTEQAYQQSLQAIQNAR